MSLGNKEIMARNIKHLMDKKGVNASMICSTLNIPNTTFSDWCNAKTYPRIDKIEMLANYFNVSKSELVEDEKARISHKELTDFKQIINAYCEPDNLNTIIEIKNKAGNIGNAEKVITKYLSDKVFSQMKNIDWDEILISTDEREVIKAYRSADSLTQAMVCRTLGIEYSKEIEQTYQERDL
jgi:transcriptional regulator with XRE-family HTH domain